MKRWVAARAVLIAATTFTGYSGSERKASSPSPTATVTTTVAASPTASQTPSAAKPITCESILAPRMKSEIDLTNKERASEPSGLIARNSQPTETVRGKTREFGGVDCLYGVEVQGVAVLYGASQINDDQITPMQAELTQQHFVKADVDGFAVYSADIPAIKGAGAEDDTMPIAFAFDSERHTWFWSTKNKGYALEMLKAYRGSSAS